MKEEVERGHGVEVESPHHTIHSILFTSVEIQRNDSDPCSNNNSSNTYSAAIINMMMNLLRLNGGVGDGGPGSGRGR